MTTTDLTDFGTRIPAVRSRTHLALPDGLTFDEWRDAGLPLLEAGQAVMWWIGDWLNYGEAHYGHTYTEAAEWTGMAPGTLANAKWVAGRVESRLRRDDLAFGHHEVVAALETPRQQWFLDRALEEGWSVQQMRSEVRRWRDSLDSPKRATKPVVTHPNGAAPRASSLADDPPATPTEAESASAPLAEGSTSSRRREDSTRVDTTAAVNQLRVAAAVRVTVDQAHEKAMRAALDQAAEGLNALFAADGIPATVDVLG